uniref:UBX domain-containing protein 11 n=1 Tax=Oreochromis niloticus TaxID=8128 RepID=A0A669D418_ORENI
GDRAQSEHATTSTNTKTAKTSGSRGFHINFDLVLQRIRELNVLAGEGESFVQMTATGAQLAKKDPIPLRLYRNGIVMFDGPFRSYQEHSTQQCMQDLMDGYFPSELQERFPDGVPFEVSLSFFFLFCFWEQLSVFTEILFGLSCHPRKHATKDKRNPFRLTRVVNYSLKEDNHQITILHRNGLQSCRPRKTPLLQNR